MDEESAPTHAQSLIIAAVADVCDKDIVRAKVDEEEIQNKVLVFFEIMP